MGRTFTLFKASIATLALGLSLFGGSPAYAWIVDDMSVESININTYTGFGSVTVSTPPSEPSRGTVLAEAVHQGTPGFGFTDANSEIDVDFERAYYKEPQDSCLTVPLAVSCSASGLYSNGIFGIAGGTCSSDVSCPDATGLSASATKTGSGDDGPRGGTSSRQICGDYTFSGNAHAEGGSYAGGTGQALYSARADVVIGN